jgi:hypothetical protein
MPSNQVQIKVFAQAIYEIQVLLAGYLGSQNSADLAVREAAHLAYALHNEALAVLSGKHLDVEASLSRIRAVDRIFTENFLPRFQAHLDNEKDL